MRVTRAERDQIVAERRSGIARPASAGLTGIVDLRGTLDGRTVVVCCSGTTLRGYDDSAAPRAWPRFAVNEAIRKLAEDATYWVFSDSPIVYEYAEFCLPGTTALAMHEAGSVARQHRALAGRKVLTVDSTNVPQDYADGYRFYSRGTVLIGALEMARYMGAKRAFVFGLDCYRTRAAYYYDNRQPLVYSERLCLLHQRVKDLPIEAYMPDRIKRMVVKLDEARASGLWDGMELWCVASPHSQQRAIPLMSQEDFAALVKKETAPARRPGRSRGPVANHDGGEQVSVDETQPGASRPAEENPPCHAES